MANASKYHYLRLLTIYIHIWENEQKARKKTFSELDSGLIMVSAKPIERSKLIEQSIILLLGVEDRPISMLHLQKELFLFCEAIPKFQEIIRFSAHYKGPFSQEVNELVKEPIYSKDAFELNRNSVRLTVKGSKYYREIIGDLKEKPLYNSMMTTLKLLRTIYDKLTDDELLLLIYNSHPKYTTKSTKIVDIDRDKEQLSQSLLKKHLITEERYKELARHSIA